MRTLIGVIALAALGGAQEPRPGQVAELIEGLRSDSIEQRDAAARKLRALGKAAIPELEKAGKELPLAAQLARSIVLADEIPGIVKLFPGIEERLVSVGPRAWTELFFRLWRDAKEGEPTTETLAARERSILVVRSFAGAQTVEESGHVLNAVRTYKIVEAIPELAKILKEKDTGWHNLSLAILGELKRKESVPLLVAGLNEPAPEVRSTAVKALYEVRDPEGLAAVLPMMRDPSSGVRHDAVSVLGWAEVQSAIPGLIERLTDEEPLVRVEAADVLARFGAEESVSKIEPLLKDQALPVRSLAAAALCRLGSRSGLEIFMESPRSPIEDAFSYRYANVTYRTRYGPPPLHDLNGVRSPEAWRRLRSAAFGHATFKGTGREALEAAARLSRLTLEFPPQLSSKASDWLSEGSTGWYSWKPDTCLQVLESCYYSEVRFVLAPDRIRLLTPAEETAEWDGWWQKEKKK